MAWNEPQDGKDPWRRRDKRGDGPPDIDELLRRFRDRFGGGGGSGPGAGGIGLLVGIAVVLWALSGFYVVDAQEEAVVFQFGEYQATTGPGLHWRYPYPFQTVEKVNTGRLRDTGDRAVMLTKDENIVDVEVTVQYRVNDPGAYLFNLREPDETVQEATKSAVREIVGNSLMNEVIQKGESDDVILDPAALEPLADLAAGDEAAAQTLSEAERKQPTEQVEQPQTVTDEKLAAEVAEETSDYPEVTDRSRAKLPSNIRLLLQDTLGDYQSGIIVTKVNVNYAQPPEPVQGAFEDAIRAREEEQTKINEARAYARDVVNRARGEAEEIINEARGYRDSLVERARGESDRFTALLQEYEQAPTVVRERLYRETLGEVLLRTNKILVDSEEGQLLYLPLDQLRKHGRIINSEQSAGGGSDTSGSGGGQSGSSDPANPYRSRSRR